MYSSKNWNPEKLKIGYMPPHPSIFFRKELFEKKERSETELKKVLSMIRKYNIISDCYTKAEYFINLASNALSIFDESKEKNILQNLTSFSLERTF